MQPAHAKLPCSYTTCPDTTATSLQYNQSPVRSKLAQLLSCTPGLSACPAHTSSAPSAQRTSCQNMRHYQRGHWGPRRPPFCRLFVVDRLAAGRAAPATSTARIAASSVHMESIALGSRCGSGLWIFAVTPSTCWLHRLQTAHLALAQAVVVDPEWRSSYK